MKNHPLIATLLLLLFNSGFAQITYTANDFGRVQPYNGKFLYGANPGYYGASWDDKTLADIAAGNSSKNIKGAGIKTLRPSLPHSFLETWGYDIRLDQFNYYHSLGIRDNTVFLGTPVAAPQKDNNRYEGCSEESQLFKNLYTPIWDGGANGTPVNDDNFYALYVYNTVNRYKSFTKFWEIVNEPDFDYGQHGWKSPSDIGNWWASNPTACQLGNLSAPVYHYIRMLRISYEVIKTIDPTAYVAPGGIGYASFLDVLLRNTDNPVDGSVTAEYPLKGGAYFDVLSFHSYPIFDLRYWDNTINNIVYTRHSDASLASFLRVKTDMNAVLSNHGYNGITYPEKLWICTENNIPKKAVGDYIGSVEAQRNYILKALVESQRTGVRQLYIYMMGDLQTLAEATDGFSTMGLYQKLEGIGPLTNGGVYNQQYNEIGLVYKTTSDLLDGYTYSDVRTSQLSLSSGLAGLAFRNAADNYIYVLWAKTSIDLSEAASGNYSFPPAMNITQLTKREWNFSQTGTISTINSTGIALSATPIFLSENLVQLDIDDDSTRPVPNREEFQVSVFPNPALGQSTVKFTITSPTRVSIKLIDVNGKIVGTLAQGKSYKSGTHLVSLPAFKFAAGVYYVRFETEKSNVLRKVVIVR